MTNGKMTPERGYSFKDHARREPTKPLPGDRLDTELNRIFAALKVHTEYFTRTIKADGTLSGQIVTKENIRPDVLDFWTSEVAKNLKPHLEKAEIAEKNTQNWLIQTANHAKATQDAQRATEKLQSQSLSTLQNLKSVQTDIAGSRSRAERSSSLAQIRAQDAQTSASSARISEDMAYRWAEKLDGPVFVPEGGDPVNDGFFSSKFWANYTNTAITQGSYWYLGPKPENPTEANDGGPLQPGMWYYNTTTDQTYIWNGTTWDAISGSGGVNSVFTRRGDITAQVSDYTQFYVLKTGDDMTGPLTIEHDEADPGITIKEESGVTPTHVPFQVVRSNDQPIFRLFVNLFADSMNGEASLEHFSTSQSPGAGIKFNRFDALLIGTAVTNAPTGNASIMSRQRGDNRYLQLTDPIVTDGPYRSDISDLGQIINDHIQDENNPHNTAFTALPDTPAAYSGQAGKAVAVNQAENALEYVDFPVTANFVVKTGDIMTGPLILNQTDSSTAQSLKWTEIDAGFFTHTSSSSLRYSQAGVLAASFYPAGTSNLGHESAVVTREKGDARYVQIDGTTEITVGDSGADFTDLTDALSAAKHIAATRSSQARINIVIEDNYTWDSVALAENGHYPVTIKQRNSLTVTADAALPVGVPMFRMTRARGIVFDLQLDCNRHGAGGIRAEDNSHFSFIRGGVRNAGVQTSNESGYNLFVSKNSSFTSLVSLEDGVILDFTGADKRGIWVTRNSNAMVDFCNFDDTGISGNVTLLADVAAIFLSRGSEIYGQDGTSRNSTGYSVRIARSRATLRIWNHSGSGLEAIWAFERAVVTCNLCVFDDCQGVLTITQGGADVDINRSTGTGVAGPAFRTSGGTGQLCLDSCQITVVSAQVMIIEGPYLVSAKQAQFVGGSEVVLADTAYFNGLGMTADFTGTGHLMRAQSGAQMSLRNARINTSGGTPTNFAAVFGGSTCFANGATIGPQGSASAITTGDVNVSTFNTWASNGVVFTTS